MTNLYTSFLPWFMVLSSFVINTTGQPKLKDFRQAFEGLNQQPSSFLAKNNISYKAKGGHLQGIQLYKEHSIYLSGSSDKLSYMVKIHLGDQPKVVAIDTLMHSPLRHAGGFQIFDRFLAVGIEDNKERNLAYLQVYNLEAETPFDNPIYTVERKGDYERVTAGAVGITAYQGEILILVANWDSRVLDFYSCPAEDFYAGKGDLRLKNSIEVKKLSTADWSDPKWESYQNLNLFSDRNEQLFVVGTAKNEDGGQVADLFKLHLKPSTPKITKISSKIFHPTEGVDFKATAGLNISTSGTLILAAAPYQLEKSTTIDIFTNEPVNFPTKKKKRKNGLHLMPDKQRPPLNNIYLPLTIIP